MTANEMTPAIGATVVVRFEDIKVTCRVVDAKHVYGKSRIQVSPLSGTGMQWVELSRVTGVIDATDCKSAWKDLQRVR